jgi:hypothetical protein
VRILYLCPDLGIPVLGRKGASVHVRGLVAALCRAGHAVALSAPLLNKSPWEEPARTEARLLHLPPSAKATAAFLALKTFNHALGVENALPGEVRRILYNQDMVIQIMRRFENDPPDVIYERASLYATAGVSLARELRVPRLVELNAPLALEQSVYRTTGLGELAVQAERYTLSRADAVLTVSAALIGLFEVALAPYAHLDHAFYFSPLKLFEYMACGVPVVAAATGQIAEVVQDGATGFLYPPGDLEALTAACDRLLADSALRRRLGQAGAKVIHSRYTWDHNAARVTEPACRPSAVTPWPTNCGSYANTCRA